MTERTEEDGIGAVPATCAACVGCALSKGPAPWADSPVKAYCLAYPREGGRQKPAGVMYDGEFCALKEGAEQ